MPVIVLEPVSYTHLDVYKRQLLYCAGGWRSAVGASVLRAHGFTDVSDLLGGYGAWSLAQARAS